MAHCSTCAAPAVSVWLRAATDAEASAHWDAREAVRRSGRHPEPGYTQDRSGDVQTPVYGCERHRMPDEKSTLLHQADCAGHDTCACAA